MLRRELTQTPTFKDNRWTIAGRWAARFVLVVLVASLWVGGAQPVAVGLIPSPWDKLVHAVVFGGFAVLAGLSSKARGSALWWLAFGAAVAVGVADEAHQAFLPGRNAGWDDLMADAVGAAAGAAAIWWARCRLLWPV